MIKCLRVFATLLCFGNLSAIALAQSADPDWLNALRVQLAVDKMCEVRFFLNLRERESASGNIYSARVQCEDGRQFDATRADPDMEFTIEACGQVVCGLESPKQTGAVTPPNGSKDTS